eukprot:14668.XXX_258453_258725_1 [CDS] Oithona nana genome sequencing.
MKSFWASNPHAFTDHIIILLGIGLIKFRRSLRISSNPISNSFFFYIFSTVSIFYRSVCISCSFPFSILVHRFFGFSFSLGLRPSLCFVLF